MKDSTDNMSFEIENMIVEASPNDSGIADLSFEGSNDNSMEGPLNESSPIKPKNQNHGNLPDLKPEISESEALSKILLRTKSESETSNLRLKTKLIPALPTGPVPLNRRTRSLSCEYCGKEYQSMSGLKYHREKAQTRCNPDFFFI